MTSKEQIKILNDKIESNINQYKIDRLNAEISAFSSGDLNKYEFLITKNLKYKPNALDKARFELSPLGKAFSTGLDKTAEGYQEEGVIKLLKDRENLANNGNRLNGRNNGNRPNGRNNGNRNDDDDDDDDGDNRLDDRLDRPNNRAFGSVFFNNLNTEVNNIQNDGGYYTRLIANQNAVIDKLKIEITDRKDLTKDIIDQVAETINNIKQENLEYYNKYKQHLFEYTKALEQLNNANNIYGREIGNLTTDLNNESIRINEFRNEIQDLENAQKTFVEIINRLHREINELKNSKTILKKDNDYLKNLISSAWVTNSELSKEIKEINDSVTRDQAKIHDMLNKFKDDIETNIDNLYKKFMDKKMIWKLD